MTYYKGLEILSLLILVQTKVLDSDLYMIIISTHFFITDPNHKTYEL